MGMATSIDEYGDMLEDDIGGKKILIEGDSWVSHPLVVNLAGQIERLGKNNFQILNLAVPSYTSINILNRHSSQFEDLHQLLVNSQFSYDFDMIILIECRR